jgi:hypothetical protein
MARPDLPPDGRPDEISCAIFFPLSPLTSDVHGVLLLAGGGWTVIH